MTIKCEEGLSEDGRIFTLTLKCPEPIKLLDLIQSLGMCAHTSNENAKELSRTRLILPDEISRITVLEVASRILQMSEVNKNVIPFRKKKL